MDDWLCKDRPYAWLHLWLDFQNRRQYFSPNSVIWKENACTYLIMSLPLVARPAMIQPQTRIFAPRGVEHALVPVRLAVVSAHRVPLLRAKLLARCPFSVIFGKWNMEESDSPRFFTPRSSTQPQHITIHIMKVINSNSVF